MWFRQDAAIQRQFERQLANESGHLVYRQNGTGTAYRVTEADRKAFIEEVRLAYRRTYWQMVALLLVAVSALMIPVFVLDVDPGGGTFYAWMALLVGPVVIWFYQRTHHLLALPERRLASSPALDGPLSGHEASRRRLSAVRYRDLLLAPFAGLLIVFGFDEAFDIWSGPGRLIWTVPAGFTAAAAVQAVRKYTSERSGREPGRR
jgi:hypothetical protein